METNGKLISCDDARDLDLVNFLSGLGFEPAKIRNHDYWYLSPLRTENTPSFKVNRRLNRWYDHGLGKGGNLVDFGILYNNCTVKDFLNLLVGSKVGLRVDHPTIQAQESASNRLQILDETELRSASLLNYLKVRHVPLSIANLYCRELTYEVGFKQYQAIGFRNNAGGYEVRNASFKGSSSPKDVTTISGSSAQMNVFEGFFDFLSFTAALPPEDRELNDFMVLNSLSFFEKSKPILEKYSQVNLYLDRDKAGHNCSLEAQALSKRYIDRSDLYKGYKDVNDWAMHMGKRPHKIGRHL